MDLKFKKAITNAIRKEQYSYELYTKASKKTDIVGAKRLFIELAKQELGHKRALQSLDLEKIETKSIKFDVAAKAMLTPINELNELKKIMKYAIGRETDAYNGYISLAGISEGQLKELFQKIAGEEKKHKELIQKEYTKMF